MHTLEPTSTAARIVEWAPFRLQPGVTDSQLLDASDALQRDFLELQDGFIARDLLRGPDGQWVDLVHWRDEASANAVMGKIAGSEACQAYFHLMQGADTSDPAAGVLHLQRVRGY
jgi:hypothetical protein